MAFMCQTKPSCFRAWKKIISNIIQVFSRLKSFFFKRKPLLPIMNFLTIVMTQRGDHGHLLNEVVIKAAQTPKKIDI